MTVSWKEAKVLWDSPSQIRRFMTFTNQQVYEVLLLRIARRED